MAKHGYRFLPDRKYKRRRFVALCLLFVFAAYRKKRGVLDFVFGYPTCPLRMWNPVSTAGSSLLYDWMPLS